jgi:hypothetical protein
VQHAAVEQCADRSGRIGEVRVGVPLDRRAPARGVEEPQQRAQRRRLAGAVGPEEADDATRLHREGQVVDRQRGAEALGEPGHLDRVRHAPD